MFTEESKSFGDPLTEIGEERVQALNSDLDLVRIDLRLYKFTNGEAYILPLGKRYRKKNYLSPQLEVRYDDQKKLQLLHFSGGLSTIENHWSWLYTPQTFRHSLKDLKHPVIIMLPNFDDQGWSEKVYQEFEKLFEEEIAAEKIYLDQEPLPVPAD